MKGCVRLDFQISRFVHDLFALGFVDQGYREYWTLKRCTS